MLVETGTDRTYVADMSAPTPAFVQMTRPYALPPQEIAAANGVDQPWLATVTKSGTVLVYPLVASATAPVPTVVMPKFTTEPLEVAIGGRSAPGKPPAVVVAGGIYHVSMSVKAPGASSYPSPHEAGLGSKCFRPANSPSGAPPSVAPNGSGSYAAAWIDGCWVQFAGGALTTQGDYGAGAVGAIDAGYNATDTSPGSDAVVLLGPRPATMFATAGVGVMKLAGSAGGFPVALTDPTVVATAGHASASGGLATDGVTASSVHQTTFGSNGGGMLASATDVGGAVSTDGGTSFVRATYGRAISVGWWHGASGDWLLFGQGVFGSDPKLIAGFLNWTSSTPAAVGGNMLGSSSSELAGYPVPPIYVDAIAGVPGQDVAFVAADAYGDDYITGGTGGLRRITLAPGPQITSVTAIGNTVISNGGPLAYCSPSGSASSVRDVLLMLADDWSGGSIYRVTGATGASPTVTKVLDVPGPGPDGAGALQLDCATGTLWVASGAPGAGLLESTDGGLTFSSIPVGDPGGSPGQIRAVAVTPGNPRSLMVGDGEGFIQRSIDAGKSWTLVNDPAVDVNLTKPRDQSGGIWDLVLPA